MGMSFVTVIESILLHGHPTKSGYLLMIIIGLAVGIFGYIWESREIARYEEKKQRMTKRINAVITNRERKEVGHSQYRYIYTFTGMDEYKGITFYDRSLLLENVHVEGETVSLLINEHNLEEFWFEEEREPYKELKIWAIAVILFSLIMIPIAIRNWERVPW